MDEAVTPFPIPESTPPVTTRILRFDWIVSRIRFWSVRERSSSSEEEEGGELDSPPRRWRVVVSRVVVSCGCRFVGRNGVGVEVVLRRKGCGDVWDAHDDDDDAAKSSNVMIAAGALDGCMDMWMRFLYPVCLSKKWYLTL